LQSRGGHELAAVQDHHLLPAAPSAVLFV
jgi:hypothetical protein